MDNLVVTSLADKIKGWAAELGFDKVGIVPAAALAEDQVRFESWLELGYHGNMAWLEREPEKRSDPRILFPGARSVVVVALNYFTSHEHSSAEDHGKISRYAWGDDYHDVMGDRLRQLLARVVSEHPEINGKVCVDTAPMMDKAWAVRAGLGWMGKHSNVVTKDRGSWIFIGEMILDVELDYDTGLVADHCGTCTACLDACPTSAIVEPYVVDSTRCISYATIELRDETLPNEIASNLSGWIYGCDVCQDVCPWNRFETPTAEPAFQPRHGETALSVAAIESMEHPEYVERFRRSAMKRTKLAGLKRNAGALKTSAAVAKDSN